MGRIYQLQGTANGRCTERGMTLIEALISLLLLSLIMVAFLGILESTSRLAKAQTNMADTTENLRFSVAALVRMVRMAGTGGIPLVVPDANAANPPIPISLLLEDNVTTSQIIGGATVLNNTDVLRIRGVISSEFYEIRGADSIDFTANTIRVPDQSPYPPAGTTQSLRHPHTPAQRPMLISLVTPFNISTNIGGVRHYNDYRIVEVANDPDAVDIDTTADANGITWMTVDITTTGTSASLNPGGAWTEPTADLAYATGFIDDFAFFIANNAQGEPSLYRFPGSGTAEELVPNITNLQVALGCDINRNGAVDGNEWFGSRTSPALPTADQLNALHDVRISLVARSAAPDASWSDPTVMPENSTALSAYEATYRHKVITVRVGLRSHPGLEDV